MALEHWRYFLTLEQDLEVTTRYVEPVQANFSTFSTEFARLIVSACSEIDAVAKVLCSEIDQAQKVGNIDDYRRVIVAKYPKLPTLKVHMPRFSLQMEPWSEWGKGVNPAWWSDHQKVKHHRHTHFALANLERCAVSVGGLFALLLYLYNKELFSHRLVPKAEMFAIEKQPSTLVTGTYALPDFP